MQYICCVEIHIKFVNTKYLKIKNIFIISFVGEADFSL